jgi:hypothetical protein
VTAWPQQRRGGVLAAVAARAEAWLLEPAPARPAPAQRELPPRPVVAVVGLASRCGTTTVARALAVELARRDPCGVAVVSADAGPAAPAIATGAARRLARALGCRAAGRLALVSPDDAALGRLTVDRPAPMVLDVGHGTPPEAALGVADRAVLVASEAVEPALVEVAAASLARGASAPLLVLNRSVDAEGWRVQPDAVVGESRLAARLALAGRDPLGALAAACAALADACADAVVHA